MKSNKLLCISNLMFNLPDDFNGDLNDALELILKYRRSEEAKKKRVVNEEQTEKSKKGELRTDKQVFEDHWNSDFKLSFGHALYEYSDNKWNTRYLKDGTN